MYGSKGVSASSLQRESTNSLIYRLSDLCYASCTDMMCYTDWMILPDQHTGEAELWYEREVELWKKKELKVEFLNMDDIPTFRKEDGDPFSSESVLKIANEWHGAGIEQGCDVVPKFIRYKGDQTGSDIRVTFIGMCIGT